MAGTLVAIDGDVAGLTVLAAEAIRRSAEDPFGRGKRWLAAVVDPLASADADRASAAEAQALRLGVELRALPGSQAASGESASGPSSTWQAGLRRVVELGLAAAAMGADRLVLADHAPDPTGADGLDLHGLAVARDRALLVSQLIACCSRPAGVGEAAGSTGEDASFGVLSIETPLASLTDAQLADLALDVDGPVDLAWWYRSALDRPEARTLHRRWATLLGVGTPSVV